MKLSAEEEAMLPHARRGKPAGYLGGLHTDSDQGNYTVTDKQVYV